MNKITKKIMFILLVLVTAFSFQTTAQAKSGNTPGNLVNRGISGAPCRSGKYIYYSVLNKLYRFDTSTNKTTLLKKFTTENKSDCLTYLNEYNGKIYLLSGSQYGNIYQVSTNGKHVKKLAEDCSSCAVYNGMIYYSSCSKSKTSYAINRMKLNGSDKKNLRTISSPFIKLFVASGKIYYTSSKYTSSGIKSTTYSMKTDGSNHKKEASGYSLLAFENGYLYLWKNENTTTIISRKSLNTNKINVLMKGNIQTISVQNNYLYYIKPEKQSGRWELMYLGKYSVYKKNLKTKKTQKILSDTGFTNILACGNRLFFTRNIKIKNSSTLYAKTYITSTNGKNIKGLQTCSFNLWN